MSFPRAQQAQIIRANQRDIYHVSSLREQADNVVRSWLGSRWLSRWDKEVDVVVKFLYYGLTTGRATQTLGEEYTHIWQHTSSTIPPSLFIRTLLILLPTLPPYILTRLGGNRNRWPWVKKATVVLEVAAELNLAVFYMKGTYYDVLKRLFGVRHLSTMPQNPHTRAPSYSLLGILLAVRLLHRLLTYMRSLSHETSTKEKEKAPTSETYLDTTPISSLFEPESDNSAERDTHTALSIAAIPPALRAGRTCTLCLEERTNSTVTECGHLFCWSCIVGWGREKAECPLCRQGLKLERLLGVYNL